MGKEKKTNKKNKKTSQNASATLGKLCCDLSRTLYSGWKAPVVFCFVRLVSLSLKKKKKKSRKKKKNQFQEAKVARKSSSYVS